MTDSRKFLLTALALPCLGAPAIYAQQGGSVPLVADRRADSLAIAMQLYTQASGMPDDSRQKREAMRRAAELFSAYLTQYGDSGNVNEVLYRLACCQEGANMLTEANITLARLANETHGDFAAAAAYKLGLQAAGRSIWDKAIGYYRIAERETKNASYKSDIRLRLALAHLQCGQKPEATRILTRLVAERGMQPKILHSGLFYLAKIYVQDARYADAYRLLQRLIDLRNVDKNIRMESIMLAARLAQQLGRTDESRRLYDMVSDTEEMGKYAADAQLESLIALYRAKDYKAVFRKVNQNFYPLNDPEKEAKRSLIVGMSCFNTADYEQAAEWFRKAEKDNPAGYRAAQAAYYRLMCAVRMRTENRLSLAQHYLNEYAAPGGPGNGQPITDHVRYLYAANILPIKPAEAARQFDVINLDNLPEELRADAEYKKAWTAYKTETYDAVPTLDHFIDTYKNDPHLPEAIAMRGAILAGRGRIGEALRDFDRVIKDYPKSDAAVLSWQKAAQACRTDPQRMVRYYKGLIACHGVKPAALAEAHYKIASVLHETNTQEALPHYRKAAEIDPGTYRRIAEPALVQCYFRLNDDVMLKQSLLELEKHNVASYNALPPGILRWAGWKCFRKKDFATADKFLTDALVREPQEEYTATGGVKAHRPKVEPLVWKLLAHARLELADYERALEAGTHYISIEQQVYRKAEGMRDMTQILLGLRRAGEARKMCEAALALGIDGPIKSSLIVSLGDTFYAQALYNDAAKYYGRIANMVNDPEIKPLAVYKLISALTKAGKRQEAASYQEVLTAGFPEWTPPQEAERLIQQPSKSSADR